LLPLLANADDDFTTWCGEVRGVCLQAWASLIKVARQGADQKGMAPELAQQLLSTGLRTSFALLEKNKGPETLCAITSGIAECIRSVGTGIVQASELAHIVGIMFETVDKSINRTAKAQHQRAPAADEDDDEDWGQHEEEQLRRNCEEVLAALMEVSADHFLPCLPVCSERIGKWLQSKQNKVLGLYLSCDILLHLKERSQSIWPVFMPQVFKSLEMGAKGPCEEDADARLAAAYAINVAAPYAAFEEAAAEAYRRLAKIVGSPRPKKRDSSGRKALDNAVAALMSLIREKPGSCPPEIQAWPLILARLPLRDDESEAQKSHEKLVDLVMAKDAGLLGPSNSNLASVLSSLAEVQGSKNLCNEATDAKIVKVFQLVPREMLQGFAAGFSEKQQKKIEKMLSG